jgi:hypothetical protein
VDLGGLLGLRGHPRILRRRTGTRRNQMFTCAIHGRRKL